MLAQFPRDAQQYPAGLYDAQISRGKIFFGPVQDRSWSLIFLTALILEVDARDSQPPRLVRLPVDQIVVRPGSFRPDEAIRSAVVKDVRFLIVVSGRLFGRLHDLARGKPAKIPLDTALVIDRNPHSAFARIAARRHGVEGQQKLIDAPECSIVAHRPPGSVHETRGRVDKFYRARCSSP